MINLGEEEGQLGCDGALLYSELLLPQADGVGQQRKGWLSCSLHSFSVRLAILSLPPALQMVLPQGGREPL